MSTDIVQRLLSAPFSPGKIQLMRQEAADEIERLRKEIERLKRLMDMRRNWPND